MSERVIACNLTMEEIGQLAEMVKKNGLSKIKIINHGAENQICIEKENTAAAPAPVVPAAPAPAAVAVAAAAPAVAEPAANEAEEKVYEGNVIESPIVGTFYSSPAPDKEPFVKVGSQVKKGDVIMIIESMKLMNEVQSEVDGTVTEILVENGEPVEYGQPIMVIK